MATKPPVRMKQTQDLTDLHGAISRKRLRRTMLAVSALVLIKHPPAAGCPSTLFDVLHLFAAGAHTCLIHRNLLGIHSLLATTLATAFLTRFGSTALNSTPKPSTPQLLRSVTLACGLARAHAMAISTNWPGVNASILAHTFATSRSMRGQLALVSTAMPMRLLGRFCWYLRF